MKHLSEFTDLTRAQVEALLECFDFLRNGYIQVIDYNEGDVWIIQMRHKEKKRKLTISIKAFEYTIKKDGKLVKTVTYQWSGNRYKLFVNSDMSVGVVRTRWCGGVNSVSS